MKVADEINRRYVPPPPGSGPAAALDAARRRLAPLWINAVRLALLPVLLGAALTILLYLRLYLWRRGPGRATLHEDALDSVHLFVRQYPLHLYPILCKCLELAVLREELRELPQQGNRVLEVAIGDGTLSARVFPPGAEVVGLDLSPHYLHLARQMPHVRDAIVCDCMEPPVRAGSFDLIVANNFLHHVTQKSQPLAAWSRIAAKAVFNENTRFWASSWVAPYLLARLGLRASAARISQRIEQYHWQHLLEVERLNPIVAEHYDVERAVSYLSERTFFLCAIFSFLMRCTGPPTPGMPKQLFLGPLRGVALPMTQRLATLLVRFDAFQDRSKDAYVSYVGRSRSFQRAAGVHYLLCPNCQGGLDPHDQCLKCGVEYVRADGMLFLLPRELDHIRLGYGPAGSTTRERELL